MWRNDRDRPDDPPSSELETQRLARDEYDRPRYGSGPSGFGPRPSEPLPEPRGQGMPDRSFRQIPYCGHARQLDEVRVHEIMTRRVTGVHPAIPVERAARLMEECDCGALPVVGDNGLLVGMITDRDITLRIVARGRNPRRAIVSDCLTERVFACYANESVAECMLQMARHKVRRMPIVDDRGRLVGIVAQADLARHSAHHAIVEERRALTEVLGAVSTPTPYR